MARRILGEIFADAIQIVAPPAHVHLEFAGDHRQDLEYVGRRLHRRVDDDLAHAAVATFGRVRLYRQVDTTRFGEEGKRKTRADTESVLHVAAAAFEA